MSVFRFIAAGKADYSVKTMCRVLGVSRAGFYAWSNRKPSGRARADEQLTSRIREIHGENRGVYGSPRIHAELRLADGVRVGRKRVERLMRAAGISGLASRKKGRTTIRVPGVRVCDDLLDRNFLSSAPNRLWVADITYLRTWEGWLYLAAVQDLYSRKIVGWSMTDRMRTELVTDALGMALDRRSPDRGLIHHSDQGSQYVSLTFGQKARAAGIAQSMGSKGDCYDNTVAESFFATLKKEMVHRRAWPTKAELRIEVFYNRQRRHTPRATLTSRIREHHTPTTSNESSSSRIINRVHRTGGNPKLYSLPAAPAAKAPSDLHPPIPAQARSPVVRASPFPFARLARRLACLGVVLAAGALGGCASMAPSGSPVSSRLEVRGAVVEAHMLPGDQLLAGPVLLDHRAVWVEAGSRLLVRSLDASGRTRTIFSTEKTPGAPKGAVWPFWVWSIAAGDGRVAFVEGVIPCASAPPGLMRCAHSTEGGQPDSVTLFAGPPGGIRPVESLVHPGRRCQGRPEPAAVAVADIGLIDYEVTPYRCAPGVSRLALRSFSGRLVRVLAQGRNLEMPLVAGDWALSPSEYGRPGPIKITRLSTGKTALRLQQRCWLRFTDGIALDRSGQFALMNNSRGPRQSSCQQQRGNVVRVGQIGDSQMRLLATHAGEATSTTSIAIADGYVAYGRQTGRSRADTEVMVAAPASTPTPIPGMKFGPLAFDGQVVASAHENVVQLAALRKSRR